MFVIHSASAEAHPDGLVELTVWSTEDTGPMKEFTPARVVMLDVPHATELLGTLHLALEKIRWATQA